MGNGTHVNRSRDSKELPDLRELESANDLLQCVAACCSVWQFVAVRCNVLQCVAVCCSELQFVACHDSRDSKQASRLPYSRELQCAHDVLQLVANDVLQCVALCCSVLQCVAAR